MNGLEASWDYGGTAWANPPYGRSIGKWITKALDEASKGNPSVVLVPSRTDTKWFQDMWRADALIFIKGRLKFQGATSSAPFPSVLAVFGRGLSKGEIDVLSEIGKVIIP
jgi:hypothetical protein